ncbi:MAG: hypothetical protein GX610_02605 [Rhodococcus sp.]|nr:hypothetical protein [Rhodococcus sp. (in: high G+C Gram-positive bacteria)]
MPYATEAILLAVFVLATSIWIGGYVAIAVVARTATTTLSTAERVTFFRSLGRAYFWVGCPALIVALATGAVLARDLAWDALLVTTVVIAALLVVSFAVAVAQARRMTRLRRALLQSPDDEQLTARVRAGARAAAGLRAALGVLSVILVVLGAFLAA